MKASALLLALVVAFGFPGEPGETSVSAVADVAVPVPFTLGSAPVPEDPPDLLPAAPPTGPITRTTRTASALPPPDVAPDSHRLPPARAPPVLNLLP